MKTKIALAMLVRDAGAYLEDYFIPYFTKFEKRFPHLDLNYFFLENDSTDATAYLIEDFLKIRPGKLKTFAVGLMEKRSEFISAEAGSKMHKLAGLRTELNALIPHDEYDYITYMDTDINFAKNPVRRLITLLEQNKTLGMVCANGIIRKGLWKGLYYDTWACEFLNGKTPHGHSENPDLYPQGCASDEIKNVYGFMIPVHHPHTIKVNSAFGGLGMVRPHLAKDFVWTAEGRFNFVNCGRKLSRGATCEHKSFCEYIRNEGYSVEIDPGAIVTWMRDEPEALIRGKIVNPRQQRDSRVVNTL